MSNAIDHAGDGKKQGWYYETGGKRIGPLSLDEVRDQVNKGKLSPYTMLQQLDGPRMAASLVLRRGEEATPEPATQEEVAVAAIVSEEPVVAQPVAPPPPVFPLPPPPPDAPAAQSPFDASVSPVQSSRSIENPSSEQPTKPGLLVPLFFIGIDAMIALNCFSSKGANSVPLTSAIPAAVSMIGLGVVLLLRHSGGWRVSLLPVFLIGLGVVAIAWHLMGLDSMPTSRVIAGGVALIILGLSILARQREPREGGPTSKN